MIKKACNKNYSMHWSSVQPFFSFFKLRLTAAIKNLTNGKGVWEKAKIFADVAFTVWDLMLRKNKSYWF